MTTPSAEKTLHLTTSGRRTRKPHVVEIWFVMNNDKVYLSHEGEETDWMKNIRKDSQVFLKINGKDFVGEAHFLNESTDELWRAKVALYEKYYGQASREIIMDWFSQSTLLSIKVLTVN